MYSPIRTHKAFAHCPADARPVRITNSQQFAAAEQEGGKNLRDKFRMVLDGRISLRAGRPRGGRASCWRIKSTDANAKANAPLEAAVATPWHRIFGMALAQYFSGTAWQ